jgi:integrase
LLREHQAEQERTAARQLWQDGGWLFTDPTGCLLHLRTDTKYWKELLTVAGVRAARLLSRPGARCRCFYRPVSRPLAE